MKDEKIINGINKVRAEFSLIVYYGVILSILIKVFYFGCGFNDIITEYIIVVAFPIYQLIRTAMLKINMWDSEKGRKKSTQWIYTIVVIAFVSLGYLYVWHTKKNFGVESGLNYLLFIGCFAIVYFITGKYRKHLEKKYENEFSQDDKSDKEWQLKIFFYNHP